MGRNRYKQHNKYEPAVDPKLCAAAVHNDYGVGHHQCTRKHLPRRSWCKQHTPEAAKAREEAVVQRYKAKQARRSHIRTGVAWSIVIEALAQHDTELADKVRDAQEMCTDE